MILGCSHRSNGVFEVSAQGVKLYMRNEALGVVVMGKAVMKGTDLPPRPGKRHLNGKSTSGQTMSSFRSPNVIRILKLITMPKLRIRVLCHKNHSKGLRNV